MNSIKTDLDAFEYVVEQLKNQNQRSMDDNENCQYRGHGENTVDQLRKEIIAEHGEEFDDYFHIFLDALYEIPCDAKCAVGHLISDNFYDSDIEGHTLDDSIFELVQKSNPDWNATKSAYNMLAHLQKVHDTYNVSHWEEQFNTLRKRFDKDGRYLGLFS